MLKKIIKSIIHKLFKIGLNEDLRIKAEEINAYLKNNATISPSAIIFGTIINNQNNSSKVLIKQYARVMGNLFLFKHGGEIIIGCHSYVGPNTNIQSAKRISIGDNVLIAHNVNIIDNNSHPLDSKERNNDYKNSLINGLAESINLNEKEIIIEDDVWIGFNCTILKGVKIGRGAIIGANTVLTKDVPPYAVIVSNPNNTIIKYTS